MDYIGYRGDAGTVGGFACSCQPTESDCIFPEGSVGTEHSFYQEREKVKTGKDERFSWYDYLFTI